jgi:hypothetical protein
MKPNERKIQLPDGRIITRVIHAEPLGNFCMLSIQFDKEKYTVGEGDEYMRGEPEIYTFNSYSIRQFNQKYGTTFDPYGCKEISVINDHNEGR